MGQPTENPSGIGSVPRYELVRLSREWRQRFSLTEVGLPRPDVQWAGGKQPASVRAKKPLILNGPGVTGRAPATGGAAPVSPWATPLEIARATGLTETEVTAHLDRLRNRWQKSVKPLTSVREDLLEILEAHGRTSRRTGRPPRAVDINARGGDF
jgi:hypothetical protein